MQRAVYPRQADVNYPGEASFAYCCLLAGDALAENGTFTEDDLMQEQPQQAPETNVKSELPTGFTDVFISYSRKDKAFVQELSAALRSTKREVWVDWHDILPSEDFLQAIFAGSDPADTFVFVMSPDSISSEVCFKEVLHAVEGKKRIIPV